MSSTSDLTATAMEAGVKKASESAVDRALNAIGDFVKQKYGEAQVLLGAGFKRYLRNATQRYNCVHTIATGTEPRPIIGPNNIYVSIGVLYQGKEYSTETVDPLIGIGNNLLIVGTGGVGKSMLMRYLFLNTADRGEYIPILIELRRIGSQTSGDISILELIYSCMQDFDTELPREQFEYSLRLGKYLFLFDGFDEIKETLSGETAEAIQSFCAKYPKNPCIVTSRPRLETSPLETFSTLESMPLTKEQAVLLASKIWDESEKTREFGHQLEDTLYDKHKDFAENPLLLSMMFLTFMYNSSIPEHLSEFYRKAYEALYSAHDNRDKGVYRREFKCKKLNEDDFKRLFSYFCFHSYMNEQYQFSEAEILSYINKGIEKIKLADVNAVDFLSDLRNAVCMIIMDGIIYRFSHRSFQAYFAAYYTSKTLTDEEQKGLFYNLLSGRNIFWDKRDFYELLYQLEPERFSINALEDGLIALQETVDHCDNPNLYFLKERYDAVGIEDGKIHEYIKAGSTYNFNLTDLFQRLIGRKQYNLYQEIDYIGLSKTIKAYIEKIGSAPDRIEYAEIDLSTSISDAERCELYQAIESADDVEKTRNALREWLVELSEKRKSLATPNFIDEL